MSVPDKIKLDGLTDGAAVSSVGASAPLISSGGTTPSLSISIDSSLQVSAGVLKLRDVTGLSVMGRSGSSTGAAQDITATADGQFLQRLAGALTWSATLSGTSVTGTPNTIPYFNGSGVLNSLILAPEFALNTSTGTLSIATGGITTVKLADGAVTNPKLATMPARSFKANSTNATGTPNDLACTGAGQVPQDTGTALVCQQLSYSSLAGSVPAVTSGSGDVNFTGPGAASTTIQTNVVSNNKLAQAAALTVKANPTNATANDQDVACSTAGTFLGNLTGTSLVCGAIPASATTGIVANWPLATIRYYAVDSVSGSDSNACFSDVSVADGGTKACATVAGLVGKYPAHLAGRMVVVVVKGGPFPAQDLSFLLTATNPASGYPLVKTTGTLASAGETAFAGDINDDIGLGAVTGTGMNAAGYHPTGTPTTSQVQLVTASGGAPGFPSNETTAPMPDGLRFRCDVATSTASLRNIARPIVQVSGTDTVFLPVTNPLPATPTSADLCYVEMPGVTFTGNLTAIGLVSRPRLVGANFSGSTSFASGTGSVTLAFARVAGALFANTTGLTLASQYTGTAGFAQVGPVRVEGGVSATQSAAFLQSSTIAGGSVGLNYSQGYALSMSDTPVFTSFQVLDSGFGVGPNYSHVVFGVDGSGYARVVGGFIGQGVSVTATKLRIANVRFYNCAYAFAFFDKNDVAATALSLTGSCVTGAQSTAAGWNFTRAQNTTLLLTGVPSAYTLTGATGDFMLTAEANSLGNSVSPPYAFASYADVQAAGELIDQQGNRISMAAASGSDNLRQRTHTTPILVTNDTGSDIPSGKIVIVSSTNAVTLAQGDTDAHATGVLGVTVTPVKNGSAAGWRGYVSTRLEQYPALSMDGVYSSGQTVYISPTTPGNGTVTSPTALQSRRRVGGATGSATIRFDPEAGAIANQVWRSNITNQTPRPITHVDGAQLVAADDGANGWTDLTIGSIPESKVTNLTTDLAALTPTSRTVTGTAPINIAGDHAAHDLSANRTWALDANGVTYPLLQQGGALSIPGRAFNSGGNWADISATAGGGGVFRESGSTLGFGNITESVVTNLTTDLGGKVSAVRNIATVLPLTGGGDLSADRTLGINDFTGSGVSHARGIVPDPGAIAGTTRFLREDGWSTVAAVAQSGSASDLGAGTLPDPRLSNIITAGACVNCNLTYDAHGRVTVAANGSAGGITQITNDVLVGPGSGSQAATIAANAVTFSKWQQLAANSIVMNPTGSTANAQAVSLGSSSGMLQYTNGAPDSFSAFGANAGWVPFGSGTNGGFTQDSTFQYNGTAGELLLGGATGTGITIEMNKAGTQSLDKAGTGDLWVGTSIASNLHFYTNSAGRMLLDSTGVLTIGNLAGTGTRCVHADASGVVSTTASDCGSGGGSVTGVTATAPLTSTGGTAPNIALSASGVTPGTYITPTFTVDATGRITSAAFTNTLQTVESDGTLVAGEATLNFQAPLHAADSGGSPFRTNVSLVTGVGLAISAGTLISQGLVAATNTDSAPGFLVNKLTSSSGNVVITNVGGAQVNLNVNPSSLSPSSPIESVLNYAVIYPLNGASTPGGWYATSSTTPGAGFLAGAFAFEYPLGVAASSGTVKVKVLNNPTVSDSFTIQITRNGTAIGTGVTVNSSISAGTVLTNVTSIAGGSTSDVYGVESTGTGADTGGSLLILDVTATISQ